MTQRKTNWDTIKNVGPEGIDQVLKKIPFYRFLDLSVEKIELGYAMLRHRPRRDLINIFEILHGGIICSLLDVAMGLALWTGTSPGEISPTLEMKINFISQIEGEEVITAQGQVLHHGQSTAVVEGSIMKEDGKMAAKALATFFIKAGKKDGSGI